MRGSKIPEGLILVAAVKTSKPRYGELNRDCQVVLQSSKLSAIGLSHFAESRSWRFCNHTKAAELVSDLSDGLVHKNERL